MHHDAQCCSTAPGVPSRRRLTQVAKRHGSPSVCLKATMPPLPSWQENTAYPCVGLHDKPLASSSRSTVIPTNNYASALSNRLVMPATSPREVWSLFSGALGLDLGFETLGLAPTLANEIEKHCCATIRLNRPDLQLLTESISTLTVDKLRARRNFDGDVHVMLGGPPCQSFSSGGKRGSLADTRGNLIYEYLRLISEVRPRYFVLENVANLTTAALRHRPIAERPGRHWSLKRYDSSSQSAAGGALPLQPEERSGSAVRKLLQDVRTLGYYVVFGILDAADYGAPQHRLRFLMVGSRDDPPPSLPEATHGGAGSGLASFRTVRDAIYDMRHDAGPGSQYTPPVRRYFAMVPPGGT